MANPIQSGHALKLNMVNPKTGKPETVGIWSEVTISVGYGATPVYALGRTGPTTIQYTHAEPVSFRARGWREADHGPYVHGMVPLVQDLIDNPKTSATLIDRQLENAGRDANVGEITDLTITGFDETTTIRQLKEFTVSGMGILHRDESGKSTEGPGATSLP